jgi:hypothetical protein
LTQEEQVVGKALKSLKKKTATPLSKIRTILGALTVWGVPEKVRLYLKRMKLEKPRNITERLYQKLLIRELR